MPFLHINERQKTINCTKYTHSETERISKGKEGHEGLQVRTPFNIRFHYYYTYYIYLYATYIKIIYKHIEYIKRKLIDSNNYL